HDLRVHCLDQRRLELDALTTRLASPHIDEAGVALATSAAWQLPDTARGADTDELARGVPLPPPGVERAHLEQLNISIANVRGELETGHHREALAHAEALMPGLASIDYPASRVAVLDLVGDARRIAGDFTGEETVRREQVRAASVARDSQ